MSLALAPLFTVIGSAVGYAFAIALVEIVGLPREFVPVFAIGGGVVAFVPWYLSDLPVTTRGDL